MHKAQGESKLPLQAFWKNVMKDFSFSASKFKIFSLLPVGQCRPVQRCTDTASALEVPVWTRQQHWQCQFRLKALTDHCFASGHCHCVYCGPCSLGRRCRRLGRRCRRRGRRRARLRAPHANVVDQLARKAKEGGPAEHECSQSRCGMVPRGARDTLPLPGGRSRSSSLPPPLLLPLLPQPARR
eukprot:2051134-Prymnesium_polylepis.1